MEGTLPNLVFSKLVCECRKKGSSVARGGYIRMLSRHAQQVESSAHEIQGFARDKEDRVGDLHDYVLSPVLSRPLHARLFCLLKEPGTNCVRSVQVEFAASYYHIFVQTEYFKSN